MILKVQIPFRKKAPNQSQTLLKQAGDFIASTAKFLSLHIQNEPANPNTKIQAATTQKSKSPNIFDIKAGGSSQIILNNPGSPETINTFNNSAGTKSIIPMQVHQKQHQILKI